jgi:uncharacterized protein YggE
MNKRKIGILAVAGVVVLALVMTVFLAQAGLRPAVAQAQETMMPPRTITVVGEGSVKIRPDVAHANIGVEVVQPTVREASTQAQVVMEAVLTALQEQGVAEVDIQTSGFSIWADRSFGPDGASEEVVRYRVSNNVFVTIRDLDTVGAVLDAAIEAGANNIYGVSFSLADTSAAESDARSQAVDDALAKAQELAALNEAEVGEVISISEVIAGGGGFYAGLRGVAAEGLGGGGGGPIAPGELEVSLQLQIVYALQ